MAGGSHAVYSVLRNLQEPAGSWGGGCTRMKHRLPQGNAAGQQPPGQWQAHSCIGNPAPGGRDLPIAMPRGAQSRGGEK